MNLRVLVSALGAACFALALGLTLPPASAGARTLVQEVAEGLTCQCGCGLTVANCNHPNCEFSVPAREQIEKMLAHGENRVQIIAYFRARYGEKILSAPTTHGFNLLAWVTPFIALVGGAAFILVAFGRWRTRPPVPVADPPPAPDFDSELRRQLEDDLHDKL